MTFKKRTSLSLAVFSILTIFLAVFLIYPLFERIKNNSETISLQKADLASLETKTANLKKFQNLLEEIEPNLTKMDKLFINSEAPVDFISFLETIAQDCEISLKISRSLSEKSKKDIWPSLIFQISSTGSFPKFFKFFEKLENSPYLIKIQNLNIRRLTEKELKSKEFSQFALSDVKASILIQVYAK